jgi:GT2 family glycosyltransferase
MDERYFLYFEDLDWGVRAKTLGPIGYAHASIVPHKGGTTIGTSLSRRKQSPLAVYLEFRNRIIFIRKHFPRWLLWTIALAFVYVARYLAEGSVQNTIAAVRGLSAGLLGQTGRPDDILKSHLRVRELTTS